MSEGNGTYTESKPDKIMGARVDSARSKRDAVLESGKRIEGLLYGKMSSGDLNAAGYVDATVPVFAKHEQALTSAIYYKNPDLDVRRRDGQDALMAERARLEQRKLEYYVGETDLMSQIKLAFAQCKTHGTGFAECFFSEKLGHTVARWAPLSQVLVDDDTDESPSVSDVMWMARERAYGLDYAKTRWPEHEWHTIHEDNSYTGEHYRVGEDTMHRLGAEKPKGSGGKRVRVLQVWLRGTDEAEGTGASQLAADNEAGKDEKPERLLYEKSNQVAWYEITTDGLKEIEREKAEYVCDDFPLIPLRLHADPRDFYASSVLAPFYDLASQVNAMLRVANTAAVKHARTVHILDESVFTAEEAKQINEGRDHLVFRKKDVLRAANAWHRLDFGEPKQFPVESGRVNMEIYRDLANIDALTLGSPGGGGGVERSATGSALLDKRSQKVVQMFADEFEHFVARVFRTISQIDRSLMKRDQVQKIVGPDIEVTEELWPQKWDDDDILKEYDVIIESRSMRYVSEEQRAADMNALMDRQIQFIAQIPPMVETLGLPATALIVEKFNESLKREAKLMNVRNPEDLLIPPEELLAAMVEGQPQPEPQPPQPSTPALPSPEAGGAVAPEGMTDQAISQQAQMIAAGQLDPRSADTAAIEMATAMMQGG